MDSCIFCKMVSKEIPVNPIYEDDLVFAFDDISPVSPLHVLVIPKKHVENVLEIDKLSEGTVARIMETCSAIAKERGIADSGFRIVCNCGPDGGQSVGHLHYHLLGKRSFAWPPG